MRLLDLRQGAPSWEAVPMSDLLRSTLARQKSPANPQTPLINISVAQLEAMALEISTLRENDSLFTKTEAKFREQVIALEGQVRSYEQSFGTIQQKYKEAIGDRGVFEAKCKKAELEVKASESRFQELWSKHDALKAELAASKKLLLGSSNPEIAKTARLEKELEEASAQVQSLEKRAVIANKELEYSRIAYQDTSNLFAQVNQENQELKARIADLEHRASDNIRKIHEINAKMLKDSEERQLSEHRAIIRERERELSAAREELRVLKNGRRETRQGSVPRSPRTSMMSPRPGRVVAGASSRGTSPAPAYETQGTPVYLEKPPSTARWPHLRD